MLSSSHDRFFGMSGISARLPPMTRATTSSARAPPDGSGEGARTNARGGRDPH